jgi:hypothetical protein
MFIASFEMFQVTIETRIGKAWGRLGVKTLHMTYTLSPLSYPEGTGAPERPE